jgi:vacuolar protein sorting-associated protein 13A/C
VAVWAGKIQLHSLQLDVQAVNQELTRQAKETPNLAVPFRVVDGSFESLQVDVPWARISSKPVVLRARGLHVVIEPFDHWKHGAGGGNGGGKKKETTRVSARRRRETSSEFFECDAVEEEEEEQHEKGEEKDCDDEIDDDDDDNDDDEQDSDHESSMDTPRTTTSTPGMRKKNKKRRPHKNRLKHAIDEQDNDERYHSLEMAEEARQRMNAIRKLGGALDHVQEDDPSQPQPPQLPSQLYGEESTTGTTREASSATGFKARLVRRIIENLQLEIDQVEFQIKGQGCNLGASIDKFTVFTTDKDGNKSFIDRVSNSKNILKSFLYKALDLRGLSVYCDEEQYRTPSYLSQPYRPMEEDRYGKKTFMLSPLSFRARLRQSDCVKCIDFPKYLLSAELPTVSVRLTRMQLEMIHGIMKQISEKKHVVRPLFPEYRPDVPITSKSAKLWWKYAVRSIGRITRKRSWVEFYLAYKKRKRYIDLFKRYMYSADCSWLRPLRISDRAEMDEIECDKSISTQGIMAWRNIADAQAELEMKKYEERQELKKSVAKTTPKKKMSFRSMLFGKKDADAADRTLLYSPKSEDDKDEPPISLTDAEMRELDALALESASAELALSSDSMLCDVTFEMGSFTVDLITFASAPLASLEMGTVLSYFKANADGSFKSTFSLSSLDLHDRITRKSLFPVVIRSLQSSKSDLSFDTFQNAIEVKLTKARNGDQHLEAKIVSYEIVACDFLMKELRKFVTIGKDSSYRKTAPSNPILQYSISGGADLFYDADELGGTTILASTILQDIDQLAKSLTMDQKQPSNFKDKFASAFAEAWKNKLARETIWSVQVDLHAPILVLPQSCIDPSATTLVVDLGTFHMKYGKDLATNVRYWFHQNDQGGSADMKVDNCTMELEHFSLTLTRAGTKDWLRARIDQDKTTEFYESVIDPVTFTLDVGLENGGIQRKCVFGNLEQISLVVSQSQIKRVVSLLSHWSNTMNSVSGKNDENAGVKIFSEDKVCSESVPSSTGKASLRSSTVKGRGRNVGSSDLLHLSFVLKELKVKIVNAKDESLEARLLMATASSTHSDDGSSCIRIRMGHFWVIDYLGGGFPRMQRLVAHSRLPLPPHHYAQEGNYAILESFHSSDCLPIDSLADLKIRKSTHENFENIVDSPFSAGGENVTVTIIDANFSALYLHW